MSDQILWRRLDRPGHEAARLETKDGHWYLSGSAVIAHESRPCELDYLVVCDESWKTISASVTGWVGDASVEIQLLADSERRWWRNGREVTTLGGCLDVDLNFSPSTNLLPIRRLGLAAGQEARVCAAWLRFPGFELETLEQTYRNLGGGRYRYRSESNGRPFEAELEVDANGFVTRYPGLAEREA